jgi:hypothetical protein
MRGRLILMLILFALLKFSFNESNTINFPVIGGTRERVQLDRLNCG